MEGNRPVELKLGSMRCTGHNLGHRLPACEWNCEVVAGNFTTKHLADCGNGDRGACARLVGMSAAVRFSCSRTLWGVLSPERPSPAGSLVESLALAARRKELSQYRVPDPSVNPAQPPKCRVGLDHS